MIAKSHQVFVGCPFLRAIRKNYDKLKADLVKLRYFAVLSNQQAAEALGISSSTADNYWAYARSWLRLEVADGEGAD